MWHMLKLFSSFSQVLLPSGKCGKRNVIYLISCKRCGKQHVGSATGFKERFRIHKSDIKWKKDLEYTHTQTAYAQMFINICIAKKLKKITMVKSTSHPVAFSFWKWHMAYNNKKKWKKTNNLTKV